MANYSCSKIIQFAVLFLVASASALRKSPGCGKPLKSGLKQGGTGNSNRLSIKSSGISRSYLLHLPKVYTATNAHGLIFSFHGRGKDGAEQERLSQFSNHDFNPNMLVVYPDGIKNQWQGDPAANTNDVQLVLDLIDKISNQYCIDKDRIFAAGKSNGGGFAANVLACHPTASKKIAAFAGVAGAYYQGKSASSCKAAKVPITCKAGRKPVPVLTFHGTSDGTIPYNGGPRRSRCLPTASHFISSWANRNGLGSANVSANLYDGKVTKYEFGKSRGFQGINTHYRIKGFGRKSNTLQRSTDNANRFTDQWPSTKPNDDGGSTYLNATPLIMDFFYRWELARLR